MATQNRFKTGLDIAKYTAAYEKIWQIMIIIPNYTQSLGSWHGFVAQQNIIAVKKHHTKQRVKDTFTLSGWMVAALRSEFGPLPDQSMHKKPVPH
jgi:isocitrate lyase